MTTRVQFLTQLLIGLMGFSLAMPLYAQTPVPSAEQMIQQLTGPRTRSLRNLSVEAAPAVPAASVATEARPAAVGSASGPAFALAAAAAPRPSLSLLIQFDFNSARVRPESQQSLATLSQALQSSELMNSRFAVEGHTDAKGGTDYNQKLSEARAQAVRDFIKTKGVDQDRLVVEGKGATELANNDQPFAAENRRVRIVNLD